MEVDVHGASRNKLQAPRVEVASQQLEDAVKGYFNAHPFLRPGLADQCHSVVMKMPEDPNINITLKFTQIQTKADAIEV